MKKLKEKEEAEAKERTEVLSPKKSKRKCSATAALYLK